MKKVTFLAIAAVAAICFAASAPAVEAQVSISIGPAPVCPYGYYDYTPYTCAPYGYYGPEWFTNGVFIGVGPWFHGPANFHGHVNTRYDPQRGYKGPTPKRGEKPVASRPAGHVSNFKGNEVRDGRGHTTGGKH